MNRQQTFALIKTAVFIAILPGFLVLYLPLFILREGEQTWNFGAVRFLALPLWIVGGSVLLWCAGEFALRGLGTPAPIDPPKKLIVTGLYRLVRNPMYVGALMVVLGHAVWFGSRGLLAYTAVLWLGFHLFVLWYEEPTLARMFGDSYGRYRAAVRRWLPRLSPFIEER